MKIDCLRLVKVLSDIPIVKQDFKGTRSFEFNSLADDFYFYTCILVLFPYFMFSVGFITMVLN